MVVQPSGGTDMAPGKNRQKHQRKLLCAPADEQVGLSSQHAFPEGLNVVCGNVKGVLLPGVYVSDHFEYPTKTLFIPTIAIGKR